MALDDLRQRYLEYLDPRLVDEEAGAAPPSKYTFKGNAAAKQAALDELAPETYGYGERFGRGLLKDVRDLGSSLFGVGALGMREGIRFVSDPQERIQAYSKAAAPILADPMGSLERGATAAASAMAEPYIPKEGESGFDVLKRNVLDRPLGTAMDAAALIGGPAELGAKLGIPGAETLRGAVAAADPISVAKKLAYSGPGKWVMETAVPGALKRLEANKIITDAATESTLRAQYAQQQFEGQVKNVFAGLDDTEKTLFFPYAEGRLKAMTEGGMAGQVAELTPSGAWQPRAIDPSRLARLETARQAYLPIMDQFEEMMGYRPEQAAVEGGLAEQRAIEKEGGDLLHPDSVARVQQASEEWRQRAADAQLARRTVSTRTSLDALKTQKFNEELARIRLEQGADAAEAYAKQYPVEAATPEEALAVMGPQKGVYFPHSGEIGTRDQLTIGNVLTKVRESVPWKQNTGALFRTGALDTMDPEAALMRTYVAMRGGMGLSEIYDLVGKTLGEALPAVHAVGTDPELRAGTHQLLHPGLLHQEGALTELMQEMTQRLMTHGGDAAVANLNLQDVMDAAASKIDQTFPLKKGAPVYKIPSEVGAALASFRKSFEPPSNPFVQWLDKTADPFNFVTLNLRPARIMNNVIGNTIFQVMQGIHPFSSTGIGAISDMAQAVGYKLGLTSSERAAQLAKVYDLPGVSTGGLSILGKGSRTEAALASGRFGALGKGVAGAGSRLADFNQHIENTARALSTFFELRKEAPSFWSGALGSAKNVMDIGERVESLAKQGVGALDDAGYRSALKNVNKFLNDYNRASPVERTMWRRLFPYEKFYRHAVNLALTAPFELPTRTTILRTIGKSAMQDAREQLSNWGFDWHTMVPASMQQSIPVDVQDDPKRGRQIRMLNVQGPNPFSVLSGEDPGAQGLGALHPLIKTAIEMATGVNLFTMERFHGPLTTFDGKEIGPDGTMVNSSTRPGPLSLFARQFFPVQIARDLVAGGRTPLDSASLLDMVMASATAREGQAFKVNERGIAERRPTSNPFFRTIAPVPQILETPTKEQARSQAAGASEAFNRLGRDFPELRDRMRALYREKRKAVPRRQLPYRRE